MKQFIYWFVGDRAGQVVVSTWNWLWGSPVQSGGRIAVEVAQEALLSMQRTVVQLTESTAKVQAAYDHARGELEVKRRELKNAELQAQLAYQGGNQEATRIAMMKAILIENMLPKLEEQVDQAQRWMQSLKEKLKREQEKIETYKVQMQNLRTLSEVNEALATIAKINTDLNIDSAASQFDTASSAIQYRHLKERAFSELSENPIEKINLDLDRMTLDEEINQRLQQLHEEINQHLQQLHEIPTDEARVVENAITPFSA